MCVVVSHMAPTRDLACNPGTCPDWASNHQPFGSQPTFSPLSYTSQGNISYTLGTLFSTSRTLYALSLQKFL